MDLRGKLSAKQLERACAVLDYQPFYLTDELQTGAAYSWVYGVGLRKPTLLYRKTEHEDEWDRITDSNMRLRRMYDAFMAAIADRYSGGTYLDFACNNGYFPIKAQSLGMRKTFGADRSPYLKDSMDLLNDILGTDAEYILTNYDPPARAAPIPRKFDVVSASAVLCHLPNPLSFLSFLGSLANEAIFYFGQVVDTESLLIAYLKPHPSLSGLELPFPFQFNDNTRLSRGLLYYTFETMGFKNIIELPWSGDWLTRYFSPTEHEPALEGESRPEVLSAWRLQSEIATGASKHMAILAMR